MPESTYAELRDLSPLMDDLHNSLARVLRRLEKVKDREKAPEVQEIRRLIERIEAVQNSEGMVAMILGDEHLTKTIEMVVPKLSAMIVHKRRELTDSKIEQLLDVVMPSDPLSDVMLDIESDNVQLRQRFVKENTCLDSKAVNKQAGYTSANEAQTAWRWKNSGKIFSMDYFGTELFPAFQFEDGKPRPVISKFLQIFAGELSPWQTAFWFVAENGWLDGERPVDLLKKREDEALAAARREIERAIG